MEDCSRALMEKFMGQRNPVGSTNGACSFGECGTIFSITTSGALTTLYEFCSQTNCADGESPTSALIQGTDGSFYGVTPSGGSNPCSDRGCGTVFQISRSGALTTLHLFGEDDGNGRFPYGTLVQGTGGSFYGPTEEGGGNDAGTIYTITSSGALTTLSKFDGTNGETPRGGLVLGSDGNFYGTTIYGGNYNNGTVFKATPSGAVTTLYSFDFRDGSNPYAALIQATDGNFYGTTKEGGTNGDGTVYKITPDGVLTTLHSFHPYDGTFPIAKLVQGTDGNFCGTTPNGGPGHVGTVFEITPNGKLTRLYGFSGPDGDGPSSELVQDTNGIFYGTTSSGGFNGLGTVFSLSTGLGPFVKTNPTSGAVGTTVNILGTNFVGVSGVTFHGIAATFTVKSKSEITTTVPTGATTGVVKVVTPGGTLSSNAPFKVVP